jgi:hypothetical protein
MLSWKNYILVLGIRSNLIKPRYLSTSFIQHFHVNLLKQVSVLGAKRPHVTLSLLYQNILLSTLNAKLRQSLLFPKGEE